MAAGPKLPDVPFDLWRRALDAALAFRTLAPWEWMADADVGVLLDSNGMPWFASVLGAAGEVFGLVLYRGEAGLRTLQRTVAARGPEDWEDLRFAQDGLTVWFGPKSELRKAECDRYAALGYRPARGARLAWPSFLDHRPGFVAWPPDAQDVAWLVEALPNVTRFADLVRAHPGLFESRGQFEFPFMPTRNAPANPDGLEWRLWEAGPQQFPSRLVWLSDPAIAAQLKALPVGQGVSWDVDWFYLPDGVVDGGRPYYPRSLQIFDIRSGTCLAVDVINATDDIVERAANQLGTLMLRSGCIPQRVRVRRPNIMAVLQPWLAELGGSVKLVNRLESADKFRRGMMRFMGRD